MAKDLIDRGEYKPLIKRKLMEDTVKKFGYTVGKANRKTVQIAPYYDEDGALVAQHLRYPDKSFAWRGKSKEACLFGQHLWRDGGKRVVITEGEIDCMTVSQLQGLKWPVVSVPNGAAGAKRDLERNLQWLESHDEVILMFDNDEPGREAAQKCAPLFTPGKCKIATLPMKDANECLLNGKGKEVLTAMWEATTYRPDGIVFINDILEDAMKPVEWGVPWWIDALTTFTYGRRYGELYALGAGTGVGKTDFFTQQMAYDVETLKVPVGVIYLEQAKTETAQRIAGKIGKKRYHVPDAGWTNDELRASLEQLRGKVYLYDNFGQTDWDVVKNHIRYMALSLGVRHFYLDHLTALADPSNEKETLEAIMAEMAGLAKELQVIIHFISHLATPEGKPHEEGGRVMIRHFKGSRAIGFWSYFMFGMERNQQADDPEEKKTTTFRILKDRYTGTSTGEVLYLTYDHETGMLIPLSEPPSDCPFDPDPALEKDGRPDF